MWVKVEGQRTPDGILEATRVRVYDGELDEVAVETEVAAVDLVRMTLETTLGLRVLATPNTEIEGPSHRRHLVLAVVGVGDRVEVEGQLERDGSLRPKIDIEKPARAWSPAREQAQAHGAHRIDRRRRASHRRARAAGSAETDHPLPPAGLKGRIGPGSWTDLLAGAFVSGIHLIPG
jgi:hypothetical protein